MDGTRERHFKGSESSSEGQKSQVLPHMQIIDPKQICGHWSHTKRRIHTGEIGKGKEN
jgi:hypothetical protein